MLNFSMNQKRSIYEQGYVYVPSADLELDHKLARDFKLFRNSYYEMPEDPHLFEGEGERYRRYGRFSFHPLTRRLYLHEHDLFFQSKKFDVLYGDIERGFPPITREHLKNSFFIEILIRDFDQFPIPDMRKEYEISAHLIRICASEESETGRPAPEGIHQDGYHFGAIHLMARENLRGADNQIYDLNQKQIDQVTLENPLDSILFNDRAIFHGVSPFERREGATLAGRNMLILLYQPLEESPQRETKRECIACF